ncbi:MAG: helix-turn-helix transcriptional regulator [Bacteroidales bacterium]|nr:helix-turn-helix transcriptional regulator [Bacteroidales bacterium]MDD2425301.1 helix-turn-helix transcriptional regulator [Bacteroidales bacterium]MDD3989645.1 helix-turn-helix transcriptional regulator [Bacteroidales bacterium]
MKMIGQYIDQIIKANNCTQVDVARGIGVSRQQLNYIILGKRELTLQQALKIESYFSLPEGQILKLQTEIAIFNYKQKIKQQLFENLLKVQALWSYSNPSIENISDEELIEKVFIYLDINQISKMFELYKRDYIRKVWREKLAIQGNFLFNLNVMIALYYFDIAQPEQYLKRLEREYIKNQLNYA